MYVELTPEDTVRDLHKMLMQALPGFEFPRVDLYDYTEDVKTIYEKDMTLDDFLLGVVWEELPENAETPQRVIVDDSHFNFELTSEEINIIAILMLEAWVQRQVSSIENTRMKYSGPDFKMTSQANHLQKLLALLQDTRTKAHHMQRLYKRRRRDVNDQGRKVYRSNWDTFGFGVYY